MKLTRGQYRYPLEPYGAIVNIAIYDRHPRDPYAIMVSVPTEVRLDSQRFRKHPLGRPTSFAEHNGAIFLSPTPDQTYHAIVRVMGPVEER